MAVSPAREDPHKQEQAGQGLCADSDSLLGGIGGVGSAQDLQRMEVARMGSTAQTLQDPCAPGQILTLATSSSGRLWAKALSCELCSLSWVQLQG